MAILTLAEMKPNSKWVYLLMVLPPLFWAGNSTLARFVADQIPQITFAFWRWVIALSILIPFTWSHVKTDWPEIKKGGRNIILLGLLGIASFNALLYTRQLQVRHAKRHASIDHAYEKQRRNNLIADEQYLTK